MPYINDCNDRFRANLRTEPGQRGGKRICQLIWGDMVHPTGRRERGFAEVHARGHGEAGWVPEDCLTDDGLLEFYIIDVGQGDGILVRTPDDKWHLVDAGVSNERQDTKKGAANFIRWKFNRDLKQPARLATVTMSHPDFDHYGGMINLLSGKLAEDEELFEVDVDTFYHTGMGRFASKPSLGETVEGEIGGFPIGGYNMRRKDRFIVELLSDKASFLNPPRPLKYPFSKLAELVGRHTAAAERLGSPGGDTAWFPGYAPADNVTGADGTPLTVRILAPIVEEFTDEDGQLRRGLRQLKSESVTRNGHSVTLRFDYGDASIMLTGDLNSESQRLLLSYIDGREFASDVAKGCHHGSEDVDMRFIKAMAGGATVISSGDNESYAHPRPVILGASGFYGREIETTDKGKMPPIVYSTELARSTAITNADRVRVDHDDDDDTRARLYRPDDVDVCADGGRYRKLTKTPIVTDLIYGLVNVRTDGRRIICATMMESGKDFDIKTFYPAAA